MTAASVGISTESCARGSDVASFLPSTLRIRLLRPLAGIVNGISLGHLIPGATYELSPTLARWLISEGEAEESPLSSGDVELGDDPDSEDVFEELLGGVHVTPLAEAADHPKLSRSGDHRKHRGSSLARTRERKVHLEAEMRKEDRVRQQQNRSGQPSNLEPRNQPREQERIKGSADQPNKPQRPPGGKLPLPD